MQCAVTGAVSAVTGAVSAVAGSSVGVSFWFGYGCSGVRSGDGSRVSGGGSEIGVFLFLEPGGLPLRRLGSGTGATISSPAGTNWIGILIKTNFETHWPAAKIQRIAEIVRELKINSSDHEIPW